MPVDTVNRVVPDLIRSGRVRNPGIGIIAGQEATAARLGIDGVVVLRVLRGSPAAAAGIQASIRARGRSATSSWASAASRSTGWPS